MSPEALAFTPAEALAPMTVTLVRSDAPDCDTSCGEWLAMTGQIVPGSAVLLRTALGRLGQRSVPVLIDSPGGNVDAALLMGQMIRERKLDVVVSGTALTDCRRGDQACFARLRAGQHPGYLAAGIAACASACVLVLAAGTHRSVPPNSYVGVHQMIMHQTFRHVINTFRVMRRMVGGRAVEISRTLIATRPVSTTTVQSRAPETLYSKVDRYLLAMGIGETIMPLMRSAAPSSVHWMSPLELWATGISTDAMDAAALVARTVPPKPVVLPVMVDAATPLTTGESTSPAASDRFMTWEITREAEDANGSGCSTIKASAELPGLNFKVDVHFETAPDTWGSESSILLRFSPLDTSAADQVRAVGTIGLLQSVDWNGIPIGGPAVRLEGDVFEIHVGSSQKADALAVTAISRWIVFPLTLSKGTTVEAKLRINGLRDALQQWLQPCKDRPATTVVVPGRSAPTAPSIGPAAVIRSDTSREGGLISWTVAPSAPAASTGYPVLIGEMDFRPSHLHVHLSIERNPDPDSRTTFLIKERFSVPSGAAERLVMSVAPPQFRSAERQGQSPVSGTVTHDDADGFSIAVDRDLGDAFVSGLQGRAWLALPVVTDDGRTSDIVVPLGGAGRQPIAEWLHRCCGAAGATTSRAFTDRPDAAPTQLASRSPAIRYRTALAGLDRG